MNLLSINLRIIITNPFFTWHGCLSVPGKNQIIIFIVTQRMDSKCISNFFLVNFFTEVAIFQHFAKNCVIISQTSENDNVNRDSFHIWIEIHQISILAILVFERHSVINIIYRQSLVNMNRLETNRKWNIWDSRPQRNTELKVQYVKQFLIQVRQKVIIPRLKDIQINQDITSPLSKVYWFGNLALD